MWPIVALILGGSAATLCLAWGSVKFEGLVGLRRWIVLLGIPSTAFSTVGGVGLVEVGRLILGVALLSAILGMLALLQFVSNSYTGLTNELEQLERRPRNDD